LDVQGPIEFGCEKDAEVTNGLGDGNAVGRVRPGGEEDGGRGGAEETGVDAGGVEEHEFRFVEINGKAGKGEPGAHSVPSSGELGDG